MWETKDQMIKRLDQTTEYRPSLPAYTGTTTKKLRELLEQAKLTGSWKVPNASNHNILMNEPGRGGGWPSHSRDN